jgi:dolichyl-phosphate-mannose-protein mannosyltransferase
MNQRLSTKELVVVAGAIAIGCVLRCSQLDQVAVEHFDEGVYSSTAWYHEVSYEPYPARHLYAPPGLPWTIGLASWIFGPTVGPFLPGLLAGGLTILFVWGFTRAMFGMVAGLVVVLLASFSDYHIVYSRMALTDVPVMMWILVSVWLGATGIDQQRGRLMFLAGLACGCAWWTKYSGWLPLAIISSGSVFWWVMGGRQRCGLVRLLFLIGLMVVTSILVWCPWYFQLGDVGGYSAVAANHAAYLNRWSAWQHNLAAQINWYTQMESWLSAVAILTGMMCAGTQRWFDARRSTWNRSTTAGTGITPGLLGRFLGAALLLCIATLSIGSFGTMAAVGVSGMAGLFLWPVLSVLRHESEVAVAAKAGKRDAPRLFDEADFRAAPHLDPQLAACIITAWFCGMLLMTPRYTPFPRLLLPLLTAVWITAAAGAGWWIEACINVARKTAQTGSRSRLTLLQVAVTSLVVVSVCTGLWVLNGTSVPQMTIYEPRTGLRDASYEVAELCREAVGEQASKPSETPSFVVHAFGEPAVLYHLHQAGVVTSPVQDVDLTPASFQGQTLPTFLVFGPNALRTPGFLYDWVDGDYRYEHIGDVEWEPSQVVLFNLFSPEWLLQHPADERLQLLEVYRLR